jgi:phosphoribosylaminoimidazolecarboxamide formyltransferase/IMP cyclohydrolase
MAAIAAQGIEPIDLLVINLYPFARTVAKADCTLDDAIENIDIGGPAMLRAAAKNWPDVGVVIDPADYAQVLTELDDGGLTRATKFALARKVFAHTAAYDGTIANYLGTLMPGSEAHTAQVPVRETYPSVFTLQVAKAQALRYGENPHQSAAFYREHDAPPGTLAHAVQLQGKELSYNNIADADAAWECVKTFDEPACVIVKHANPCGVAIGASAADAYAKALKTDPTSAYGGIVAFNRAFDGAAAERIHAAKQFVEVLLAPEITAEARTLFAGKPNVRLLQVALPDAPRSAATALDFKRVGGGLLLQSADDRNVQRAELRVVTRTQPTAQQLDDLLFAWKVAKFVKSNAIVYAAGGMTLGVGAGQMSRVDSSRIASIKAANAGLSLQGCAVASDAYFPFRDGLDVVVDAGAACVIQPGGSMRDPEVIAAADERGIAMVFTGVRHFRH